MIWMVLVIAVLAFMLAWKAVWGLEYEDERTQDRRDQTHAKIEELERRVKDLEDRARN